MIQTLSCSEFASLLETVKHLVEKSENYDSFLEELGFVTTHNLFGSRTYDECNDVLVKHARIDTLGAQIFHEKYNMSQEDFEWHAFQCYSYLGRFDQCIEDLKRSTPSQPKYRSIDGRGNNLNNPHWGASGTPFSRLVSKNFEDGIYSIKKSSTGSDLPNARLIVQEVLVRAVKSPPPPVTLNVIALLIILFATHDLHYQVPMQPKAVDSEILCCSKDSDHVLENALSNSACLPIEISKEDPLYKEGKIGCLNMVRSQTGEFPGQVKPGEIMNRATAYIDLSLIYGNHESDVKSIRLYEGGKLRMGKNNLMPVDATGKYIKSMDRFVAVPMASIWPTLFSRNHNHLAERLAELNPHWDDEILFQEARRINIANLQFILINSKAIESVFGRPVNESYSDRRNAGTLVEFALTYRAAHYYLPSDMLFKNENYTETKRLRLSDTIGKIELLEDDFDDALRAAVDQSINVGPYSDEVSENPC